MNSTPAASNARRIASRFFVTGTGSACLEISNSNDRDSYNNGPDSPQSFRPKGMPTASDLNSPLNLRKGKSRICRRINPLWFPSSMATAVNVAGSVTPSDVARSIRCAIFAFVGGCSVADVNLIHSRVEDRPHR
jgi:hypothetical protein